MSPNRETTPVQYNVSVGYLRAFITVLVVAHHAMLAYHPYAPAPSASLVTQPRWWQAFPVVDSQRWAGFNLLVAFNDTFFMSLMFFLSGLFVWKSLTRKGSGSFVRDRVLRLGLPFVVAAAVIAPLAYYPSFLQTHAGTGLAGYWQQWCSLGGWPAGPAWFVWVLLAFDCLAAALFLLSPTWGTSLGRLLSSTISKPAAFFSLLAAVTVVAYIPMVIAFGPAAWTGFGPFVVQTSRILHYAAYFLIGVIVGAYGIERSLLSSASALARRWPVWVIAAVAAFGLGSVVVLTALSTPAPSMFLMVAGGLAFVLSCAASSFAFLALALRFANRRIKALDSLGENAYGVYLVHYPLVSWLQYVLLGAAVPALAKASIVLLGALALGWVVTAALRRIPAVDRVI